MLEVIGIIAFFWYITRNSLMGKIWFIFFLIALGSVTFLGPFVIYPLILVLLVGLVLIVIKYVIR
jgi:hypothetical protein